MLVSASQLLWDKDFGLWRRAAFVYPDNCLLLEKPAILYQLTVTNNIIESTDFMFRDYREVNDPDMEDAYEKDFSKKLKNGLTNSIM